MKSICIQIENILIVFIFPIIFIVVNNQFISNKAMTPCSDVRSRCHNVVTMSQCYYVFNIYSRERGLLAEGAQFMMMAVDYNIQQVLTSQLTGEVRTKLNYSIVYRHKSILRPSELRLLSKTSISLNCKTKRKAYFGC